ncbi:GntP family permease [Devriesea agamarum]|uniref:GntP family permease n=1 Tax=Devriesea agamarum TaxID=472569 RepID=UPI00071E02E1|nr:GntP family permease [Devriesea agamarum]
MDWTQNWQQTLPGWVLLLIAACAIALILVMVIRFKVHAFITLIVVSLLTALATQIPVQHIAETMVSGFGKTLGSVALLVAVGAMLGRLVETSGGAKSLAEKMVEIFGEKRAPFALGLASLVVGFPIFFDAGMLVVLPVVFAIARRLRGSLLLYAFPVIAALSVMHVFVPPHPGPVAAAEFLHADLGTVLLLGVIVAFPVWYVAGHLWGRIVGQRIPLPIPALLGNPDDGDDVTNPPRPFTIVLILLLPLVLILGNTGLSALGAANIVDAKATWVHVLRMLGESPIALLIAVIVASVVLGTRRGINGTALEKTLDSALGPICSVVLITGAGGMFGGVLRTSGIGAAIETLLSDIGLPVFVAAYVIAAVLRIAQGSATVALTTAAALIAPAVQAGHYGSLEIACIVLATAAGSVIASHVNDSGFWLVGRLMGMDVKTTLKTWTVQQTIQSVSAFIIVGVIYLLVGLAA